MNVLAPATTRDVVVLRIAEGGMGFIELVARREGRFSRLLARKRLHAHFRSDSTFQSMLIEEARLAGLVRHPNVTTVLEIGEDDQGPFFLMEYVEGASVAQILEHVEPKDRLLPIAFCVSVIAQAARGLHAAHQLVSPEGALLGVVHRDISPKNLLVGYDGLVRVADFGIAKANDNLEQTRIGVLKGNIGYMSPEYLRFQELDCRSDLFALGVVLYELLARERLYAGSETGPIARRILEEPPPDIFEIRDVPPELTALLFELLAKDRELRPDSALWVASQLEAVSASLAAIDGPFDVGEFLQAELGDLRREQGAKIEAALSASASDSSPKSSPPAPTLHLHSSAAVSADSAREEPARESSETRRRAFEPRVLRRPWRWVALAAFMLLGLGVGLSSLLLRRSETLLEPGQARLWAGGWHTCALREDELSCWGYNHRSQLGDGTDQFRMLPISVSTPHVRAAALGEHHTCALSESGRVACWGRNVKGETGQADLEPTKFPTEVLGLEHITALAAGRQHTCALDRGGAVFCWGANVTAQLGRPPFGDVGTPALVEDLPPAARLFAGAWNTCVLLREGDLRCWGANESGQLGPGVGLSSATPVAIAGTDDIVSLGIGNNARAGSKDPEIHLKAKSFICGSTRGGNAVCWGSNYTGQLGDGTRLDRTEPTPVVDVSDVLEVDVGNVHACALQRSGQVSCWGRNEFGTVGDGAMGPSTVRERAVQVEAMTDVIGLALGDSHTCVRRRHGEVACWGVNNFGQLGDGTLLLRPLPIAVNGFP